MQRIIRRHFWIVFLAFLVACGTTPPAPASSPTATSAPTLTPIPKTPTASPTETLTPMPSPTPLPLFPLDGYVMTFVKDGDLYFQDGNNSPVKLTHVGKISNAYLVSDDDQKVVFFRDDGNEYSINVDGTQEKTVILNVTNKWPFELKQGINKGIVGFVPGTHQLLFATIQCEKDDYWSPCSSSLFLVDTDTGGIRKLGDFGLSIQQYSSYLRNVKISPDGKMVAVGTSNGVDIVTMDGKVIRQNILPYQPSMPDVLFPSLFWLPDSSGLIVALPNTIYYSHAYGNYPASTIWRYTIDSNVAVQIPFDPAPMGWNFQVSPDGKWIVYGGIDSESNGYAIYLGNLADGHVQVVGDALQVLFSWSPDSQHFIVTNVQSFLGAIDTPTLTPICQLWGEWIDADHFRCLNIGENGLRLRMAEINAGAIQIYNLGFDKDIEASVFIKPK